MKVLAAFAVILLAVALAPTVKAAADTGGDTSTTTYNVQHLATCFPQVVTIIAAGCADWWIDSPTHLAPGRTGAAGSTGCMAYSGYANCYIITATVSTTVLPISVLTIKAGGDTYGGCHNQGGSAVVADPATLQTVSVKVYIGVDEGSIYCAGDILWSLETLAGGMTSLAKVRSNFEFFVPYQENQDILCNSGDFTTDTAHPDTSSVLYPKRNPCTAPTINDAITGTLTVANTGTQHLIIDSWPSLTATLSGTVNVVNSGGQAITVSGTLDNLNRFCASSATGSSCTTPTVNLGGAITVHNDGTLSVTNSGGQTMTVAGTLALSQSGTWTVTNAGGESITFAGPLTVHQDAICTAAQHCHIDSNSTSVMIGNSSQTVSFPSNLTVQASFPTTAASLGIDAWIGTLFWAALLAFFLWQDWPFPAAFALMGLLNAIIPSLPGNFQGYFLFVILGVVMQYFAGDRMTSLSPFNRRRTVKS